MFEKLVVAVLTVRSRTCCSARRAIDMVRQALQHLANVEVDLYHGLTAEFARQCGARVMVRGLRVLSDFEWEFQLALTNRQLAPISTPSA